MHVDSQDGFTLLELSIVLIIIGLVIGGVLVGRDLIRAAEFRAMNAQVEQYVAAVHTFRTKYNCLPGDCETATEYFGTFDSGHPDCNESLGFLSYPMAAGKAPGVLTCNGNNNGRIDVPEAPVFWQHLANAGLVAGSFSGTLVASGGVFCVADYSCPAIRHTGFGWFTIDALILGGNLIPGDYGALAMAWPSLLYASADAETAVQDEANQLRFLSARDQLSYDLKYDDGNPATGSVQAINPGVDTGCFTNDGDGFAYVVEEGAPSGPSCLLAMTLGFAN